MTSISTKTTNLSLSADVTKKADVLKLAELLGPYICVLKTSDHDLVEKLTAIAAKHDFLIFEDRKFADIGNTVKLQYSSGVHKIASWSHITNAHPIPGDGIVQGLAEVGEPLGRGLLLLAEMSSSGSLARGDYTREAFAMARRHRKFCIGFIGQRRIEDGGDVQMAAKSDGLGQTYRTPRDVVLGSGCDVIIVGRGIYANMGKDASDLDIVAIARSYKEAGWDAYIERTGQKA
ncbi:Orotidine 5'-phosphate decarboxylase domain-containing protein [Chytridium lagenaria]|nr:Orotidine 5'-phosphate decarboxylase domain-containing protein [Chytridium lagenaria]